MTNPFETPPSGEPVRFDPPAPVGGRRGRTAVVALITAGLVGGGIVGISALASADRPSSVAATSDEPAPSPDTIVPDDSDGDVDDPDEPVDDRDPVEHDHGRIEVAVGDGDPISIDFGDHDDETVTRLLECMPALPDFGLDLGELDGSFDVEPGEWSSDLDLGAWIDAVPLEGLEDLAGGVTVATDDGVSIVDLGDNGSVTVSTDDGDVSIETTGDATVQDIADLFGDLPFEFEGEILDGEFAEQLDEILGDVMDGVPEGFPALEQLEDLDGEAIRACIDDVLGH